MVYVKGKPLRSGKMPLREGQRMVEPETIMFTSRADIVILLNSDFQRIKLLPNNDGDLKKLMPLEKFKAKDEFVRVRAIQSVKEFQSLRDTIKLHLINDLKRNSGANIQQFLVLDFFGESHPEFIKLEGEYLYLFPSKKGIFFLNFKPSPTRSEPLAEVEFLDKEEVFAELKYVTESAPHPDSISNRQRMYVRKIYPKVPENQLIGLVRN